jgi:hypothetical protein
MGVLTPIVTSVDGWQRRHRLGGFPLAVLKKFGEDRASGLAAPVAYYAFRQRDAGQQVGQPPWPGGEQSRR